jgi:ATP-dependent Clp protease ATP-binding subunit ClpA
VNDEDLSRPISGALARFARDLTADARAGRLEIVRARDAEIARVIDILLRHGKNNPALVGPAGVGKTAIAEGLAARLAHGDVPLSLRNTKVLAVDHVSLLAGTTYRGQYEERIRALVDETRARPDVVLFIDELHNLIGQGTAMGAAMDAANMLKPALVRGDFRVIGATTDDEYDRWVRSDPALERRFQRIVVRELSSEETLDILRARQERLERHHNVLISDESLRAAVDLTDIHQTDRRRPDRAIDVLGAHARRGAIFVPRRVPDPAPPGTASRTAGRRSSGRARSTRHRRSDRQQSGLRSGAIWRRPRGNLHRTGSSPDNASSARGEEGRSSTKAGNSTGTCRTTDYTRHCRIRIGVGFVG